MRKNILAIAIFLCGLNFLSASNIQRNDAIYIFFQHFDTTNVVVEVQLYQNKIVSPFVHTIHGDSVQNPYSSSWLFLVDLDPFANMMHDGIYMFVDVRSGSVTQYRIQSPPNIDFETDIIVYPVSDSDSDILDAYSPSHSQIDFYPFGHYSSNNYALIISGGGNKSNNRKRYWNNCSYIYKSLINDYHYLPDHIQVFFADGTDPSDDYRSGALYYNSNPDLNGDGIGDFNGDASSSSIFSALSAYTTTLTERDNLFIFVSDHGILDTLSHSSYICSWGNFWGVPAYSFTDYLSRIHARSINIVMGQCHSGGFIESIRTRGICNIAISTACTKEESSYGTSNISGYSEYLKKWTDAVVLQQDSSYQADLNNDGFVSASEAFLYANEHDKYRDGYCGASETPQYYSNPIDFGQKISLWGPKMEIVGPNWFCENAHYYVSNVPSGTTINWTYSGYDNNVGFPESLLPLRITSHYDSLFVQRGVMVDRPDSLVPVGPSFKSLSFVPYVGTKDLIATLTRNGETFTLTKSITVPKTKVPSMNSTSSGIWRVGQRRAFHATNYDVEDSDCITWRIVYDNEVVYEDTGSAMAYTPTTAGIYNIQISNSCMCDAPQSSTQTFFVSYSGIKPLYVERDMDGNIVVKVQEFDDKNISNNIRILVLDNDGRVLYNEHNNELMISRNQQQGCQWLSIRYYYSDELLDSQTVIIEK